MNTYKKIVILIICLLICLSTSACFNDEKPQLLRLHIRANSNLSIDQEVKLKVRDKVSIYLENELKNVTDLNTAIIEINKRVDKIKSICDEVLSNNGFSYKSNIKVTNEYFPTRMYEELVVESGYYDALIIELGSGKGDNWWCVIYPPLCYLEVSMSDTFKYKSKIAELINKHFP